MADFTFDIFNKLPGCYLNYNASKFSKRNVDSHRFPFKRDASAICIHQSSKQVINITAAPRYI